MLDLRNVDNLKSFFINEDRLQGLSTVHVDVPEISYERYPFLKWFDNIVALAPIEPTDVTVSHGYLRDEDISEQSIRLQPGSVIERLTLTDDYCSLVGAELFDALSGVQLRHRLKMIRVLVKSYGFDVSELVQWCDGHNIPIDVVMYPTATKPDTLNRPSGAIQDASVLTSNLFFDGDRLYVEHPTYATHTIDIPHDPEQLIFDYLNLKIATYAKNASMISADCDATSDALKLRDYFLYISSSLKINKTYTFIPKFVTFPSSKLYCALRERGWVATQYGLIKPYSTEVTPVYMLSDRPRARIEHFPIKSKR